MNIEITFDNSSRQLMQKQAEAGIEQCFTCNTCTSECPIFVATGHLSPIKLIRMANYGLLDELIHSTEIWYCLKCNTCGQSCPMAVKPSALIGYLQREAQQRGVVSDDTLNRYEDLCGRLHHTRWLAAFECLHGRRDGITAAEWREWAEKAIPHSSERLQLPVSQPMALEPLFNGDSPDCCYTCRQCSGLCPVFRRSGSFDPLRIFRLTNYGLLDEILASPDIWLCLSCQRCTDHCPQKVRGHAVISHLKQLAMSARYVDKDFPQRWRELQKNLYRFFIEDVDRLFGEAASAPWVPDMAPALMAREGKCGPAVFGR